MSIPSSCIESIFSGKKLIPGAFSALKKLFKSFINKNLI